MKIKNNIRVRLFKAGTIGFEFYCALFRTSKDSNGHTAMYCIFDWEKEDGEGNYDHKFGAPNAIKEFLFNVEMNNDEVMRLNLDKSYIKARQYANNGVYISDIENLNIEVTA